MMTPSQLYDNASNHSYTAQSVIKRAISGVLVAAGMHHEEADNLLESDSQVAESIGGTAERMLRANDSLDAAQKLVSAWSSLREADDALDALARAGR